MHIRGQFPQQVWTERSKMTSWGQFLVLNWAPLHLQGAQNTGKGIYSKTRSLSLQIAWVESSAWVACPMNHWMDAGVVGCVGRECILRLACFNFALHLDEWHARKLLKAVWTILSAKGEIQPVWPVYLSCIIFLFNKRLRVGFISGLEIVCQLKL